MLRAGSRKPCRPWLCNAPARDHKKVTDDLGGLGIFGVELFVKGDEVWFSEVSPGPHDTAVKMSEFITANC